MRMALLALAITTASAATCQPARLSAGEQAALQRASERGAMIYAYDQAAWHGTDDLLAVLPDAPQRIGGYVVDGPATAPRIVFFDKSRTKAVYVATVTPGKPVVGKVLGTADDASLSPLDLRMIAALSAARSALLATKGVFVCATKPFNTVVLPPETPDGPVPVYFLSPQTTADAIPFGGHYKVDVDPAGHAGVPHAFSHTCIAASRHPDLPRGGAPTFFVITGFTDPTPTEIHVFSSLALRLPVIVTTPGPPARLWPIHGAHVGEPVLLKP